MCECASPKWCFRTQFFLRSMTSYDSIATFGLLSRKFKTRATRFSYLLRWSSEPWCQFRTLLNFVGCPGRIIIEQPRVQEGWQSASIRGVHYISSHHPNRTCCYRSSHSKEIGSATEARPWSVRGHWIFAFTRDLISLDSDACQQRHGKTDRSSCGR